MKNNTAKLMTAFVIGQIVQIAINLIVTVNLMRFPVLCCAAAGFLVTVAVVAGIALSNSEVEKPKQLTYRDYAEGRG